MDNPSLPDLPPLRDTRPRRVGLRVSPGTQTPTIELDEPKSPGGIIITKEFTMPEPGTVDEKFPLSYTWRDYSLWRQTKCPPDAFHFAVWLDEMNQAIHEFVGESSELADSLLEVGPFVRINDEASAKVINEIGDAIFTASWVMDLIDPSFLENRGRIVEGFLPEDARDRLAMQHSGMALLDPSHLHDLAKAPEEVASQAIDWHQEVMGSLLNLTINAGFLANAFKKIRWHRTPQNQNASAERIFNAFVSIDAICSLCGLTMFAAAKKNVEKLDKRFPNGWRPGGGNR